MARARNIKPGFFSNDLLAELDPLTRLLFIGLWCIADREGRLEDRPKKIKAEVLPYDDGDVDSMLGQLHNKCFIVRYSTDALKLIQINNFLKHQAPHKNEKESELPEYSGTSTVQVPEPDGPCTVGLALIEDRGLMIEDSGLRIPDSGLMNDEAETETPPPPPAKPKAAKPPKPADNSKPVMVFPVVGVGTTEWTLTENKLIEYGQAFPGVDTLQECRNARQWCIDNPRKRKTPDGMPAFLTRWLTREQNRSKASGGVSDPRGNLALRDRLKAEARGAE